MGSILSGTVYEDSSVTIIGQLIDLADGSLLTQSDFGSITYGIFKADGTQVVAAATALTVATVIKDTAITNEKLWGLDSTGANFIATFAKDVLVDPDTEYHIEVEFAPTGHQFGGVWIVNTRGWNTS